MFLSTYLRRNQSEMWRKQCFRQRSRRKVQHHGGLGSLCPPTVAIWLLQKFLLPAELPFRLFGTLKPPVVLASWEGSWCSRHRAILHILGETVPVNIINPRPLWSTQQSKFEQDCGSHHQSSKAGTQTNLLLSWQSERLYCVLYDALLSMTDSVVVRNNNCGAW